ncbi:MAG: hypothetical protein SPJ06_03975 [Bacilli bacterium]|nr:hypothetical protein [Bacilli bacterium]
MIGVDLLKLLLEGYGIDPNKVIKNNENVLVKGNYDEIESVIKYLIGELKISPKNIEKSPSILYFNVSAIRKNVEFLQKQHISFSNVETCLHVLNTVPFQLEETYNYVRDNYGVKHINEITSILSVNVERIQEIEKLALDKDTTLSAAISRLSIDDIVADVQICRENNVDLKDNVTVFNRTSDEIKDMVKVCRENNIDPKGAVFQRTADEIKDIIEVCRENNVDITDSVFRRSADEIKDIIEVCRENNVDLKDNATIFIKTADKIKDIIEVCRKNNIKITGSVFFRTADKLQSSIDFIKEHYDSSYLTPLIIVRDDKNLSKVFPYLDELGVLETVRQSASILGLKLDEIRERKNFVDSIGEPMVLENGKFNSVFGMSRKKYAERVSNVKKNSDGDSYGGK